MGCRGGGFNTNLDNMNNKPQIIENKVQLIKIAIDMHLKSYRVVRQLDHSMVQPAQRFEPRRFYPWLAKQKKRPNASQFVTKQAVLDTSRRVGCRRWGW